MSNLHDAGNAQDDHASPPKRLRRSPAPEPASVLYNRSPSPPTSSSLASSSAPEPPPISAEDWEAVLSGDMAAPPAAARSQDSCFLRWIMDDDAQVDAFDPFLAPPLCQEPAVDPFLLQLQLQPQPPLPVAEDLEPQPQAVVDELLEAARRADPGDSTGAREILTRLNHRLPSPLLGHPPLLRAAAHLRDALLRLLVTPAALPPGSVSSPLDVALKLAAHKALADASPTVQFASFTSTQALLDALGAARRVHVVDLDVGFGARWPPLMQELALQWRRASAQLPPPSMKVTALVSPGSSAHPMELRLTHESLTRFAADLGIRFEFDAVVFDPLDPSPPVGMSAAAPGEAVAVHLPLGSGTFSAAPSTLRVVKQLRPAIVVCATTGATAATCRCRITPSTSCAPARRSSSRMDAAGAPADAVAKVEQYILRPRVERLLLGDRMPPWQTMFASAGFAPVQLSSAAEAQAECLVRRTTTPGFHVEKRLSALALRWQQSELVTVSAWRC
ncbi:scarecrow-like 6 [Panicum miliaceum]|uniref:Scarecrow-like 6 n=1 Tax=Panicum miliaceum TaxID=4540 RepID=A0A3L6RZC1_PANMI|nr:scarecrow-like 6 [Panicum miliaceum]